MARASSRGESVKSESRSTLTSKKIEERFVLGRQHFAQEAGTGVLFKGQDVRLAAAGVEQDANGQGEVLLLGETFDGLSSLVLGDLAIVFAEAADEAVLVARGEVDVDPELTLTLSVGASGPMGSGAAAGALLGGGGSVGRGGVPADARGSRGPATGARATGRRDGAETRRAYTLLDAQAVPLGDMEGWQASRWVADRCNNRY